MLVAYICAKDGCRMKLVSGSYGLYYRCPQNTKEKNSNCNSTLTLGAANRIEEFVDQLEDQNLLDEYSRRGTVVQMKKCSFRLEKVNDCLCKAIINRKQKEEVL